MNFEEAKRVIKDRCRDYLRMKHGITIKGNENTRCPSCGGNPQSTKFSIKNNQMHCFKCDFNGDTLELIAKDNGLDIKKDFREVVKIGCEFFNIILEDEKEPYKKETKQQSQKQILTQSTMYLVPQDYEYTDIILQAHGQVLQTDYFTNRGFSKELIEKYKLGFSPNGYNALLIKYPELRINTPQWGCYQYVIPVLNQDGTCNYFMVRANDNLVKGKHIKTMNMKGLDGKNPVRLFNDRYIINHDYYKIDTLFIVEGWADALSIEEVGYNAIALNSVANIRKFINLCITYRSKIKFIICLDNDVAGNEAKTKLLNELTKHGYSAAIGEIMGNCKDVNDFLLQDRESFVKAVEDAIKDTKALNEINSTDKTGDIIVNQGDENTTQFIGSPLQLCCGGWVCNKDGIVMCINQSDNKWIRASFQQILPIGVIENMETGEQKYMIAFSQWRNQSYVWKTINVSPVTCSSSRQIINLASLGISVTDSTAKHLVLYIADMYRLNPNTIPVYKSISHMGWIHNCFFPYTNDIIFDGDAEQTKIVESMKQQGDFNLWKNEVIKCRKNLAVRLMMDASFASTLISKIGGLCFVVHLRGSSNAGKTVAIIVSASIWGVPDRLYMSVDSTMNYCTNRAAFLKNLPVLVDETQLAKGSLDKLIYSLSEGKTRGRLDRNSQEKDGKSWECVSIFTGENSIVNSQSGAGAINRVIEIETEGALFEDFAHILDVVRNNYGHAGKQFIEYIQSSDIKVIREEYRLICKELKEKTSSTGKQIQSLAFILLADRIAQRCVFLSEDALNLDEISKLLKNEKEISQSERAYQFIIDWIALNENYFSENSPKILGKVTKEFCLINQNELISTLSEKEFDFNSIKKEWAEKKYLERNSQGKYSFQTTVGNKETKANYIKILFPVEKSFIDYKDIAINESDIPFM